MAEASGPAVEGTRSRSSGVRFDVVRGEIPGRGPLARARGERSRVYRFLHLGGGESRRSARGLDRNRPGRRRATRVQHVGRSRVSGAGTRRTAAGRCPDVGSTNLARGRNPPRGESEAGRGGRPLSFARLPIHGVFVPFGPLRRRGGPRDGAFRDPCRPSVSRCQGSAMLVPAPSGRTLDRGRWVRARRGRTAASAELTSRPEILTSYAQPLSAPGAGARRAAGVRAVEGAHPAIPSRAKAHRLRCRRGTRRLGHAVGSARP
jgi:hypothetical protein